MQLQSIKIIRNTKLVLANMGMVSIAPFSGGCRAINPNGNPNGLPTVISASDAPVFALADPMVPGCCPEDSLASGISGYQWGRNSLPW